jgi:hypothetical protein
MKLFGTYKLEWWHIGLIKITLLLFGIVIGAYWYIFWMPYVVTLLVIAIILALYLLFTCWGKGK